MSAQSTVSRGKKSRLLPVLLLFAGGGLLGVSTNLAKLAVGIGMTPLAFLTWSLAGAALLLLTGAALRGSLPPLNNRSIKYYAVAALVGVAGPNFIFFEAIPHVGASFVALMIALPPLLTYAGALAMGMEGFQWARALGVVAALGGAGVLAASRQIASDADLFWTVLVLLGPALLAVGNIYRTLKWPAGVSAHALATGMLFVAVFMLMLFSMLPGYSLAVPMDRSLPVVLTLAQAFVFAAQFQVLFLLQKTGGPVLLSLLGSVGAVVAVPVAIYLQNEAPPAGLLPGAGLIALGVALIAGSRAKLAARSPRGRQ
ncbi:DMT family transporter [Pusillimonas noertemannii]|uniref:EamA-like transporter family protein n=1 Tax=Pusillimonas noertemannii TaxID=305977 RepID=A0A2U1CNI9_9BURK|nr:DMT family transporter [Pusillimonas noertemannii]NYT68402.1 DMT family transporter [Pusillimonas noertemannii]PVY62581.1 EamA-like transporter family protein [Pusillimonas noertemannii]TFL10470.1 DMT family transporter [Pusillimonas noertemannii]